MAAAVMDTVQYTGFGGGGSALQHRKLPVKLPQKGQVLVKLEAASLNPLDGRIQAGTMRPFCPASLPYIPGTDIAGVVVSVGPDVKDFAPGDKIVSWLDRKSGGALAQYALASSKNTVKRPPELTALDGACLPVSGTIAMQCYMNSNVGFDGSYKGNVLITAASGGVGVFAVQLGKLSGAHVTATCGERNIPLLKTLGADEVLDYKSYEGSTLKSPSGKKYDLVINCAPSVSYHKHLKANISLEATVYELVPRAKNYIKEGLNKLSFSKHKYTLVKTSNPTTMHLEKLVEFVKQGKMRVVVDSLHALEKADEAWNQCMSGHATGKVVVKICEE